MSQSCWIIDDERMGESSVEVKFTPNTGHNLSNLACCSGNSGGDLEMLTVISVLLRRRY